MVEVLITSSDPAAPRARVTGELDADNCSGAGEKLLADASLLSGALVVDVSGLGFIDSSGISMFLDVQDAMNARGGSLRLAEPTEAVRRVLEITGLLTTFGLD